MSGIVILVFEIMCRDLYDIWIGGVIFYFFFFQAEDGIRYLVRSRGLGDVYKRQAQSVFTHLPLNHLRLCLANLARRLVTPCRFYFTTVSYTHLTLPTSDLV